MTEVNNSTRSYPRSAIQAFPKTLEYGAAIEVPYQGNKRLWKKLLACAIFYAMIVCWVAP